MEDDNLPATQPVDDRVLKDVVAYVEVRSGHDNRSRAVCKELVQLGAVVEKKFTDDVTHVIFKEGSKRTINKAQKKGIHLLSVLWVDSCKRNQEHVSERMYPATLPNQEGTPLLLTKLKKAKSMQPVDFEEELANSAERCAKRKRRRDKKTTVSTNATPTDSPHIQSRILVPDTQPRTPMNDMSTPIRLYIPDTPPSMRAKMESMRKAREDGEDGPFEPENPIPSEEPEEDIPLQRKLSFGGKELVEGPVLTLDNLKEFASSSQNSTSSKETSSLPCSTTKKKTTNNRRKSVASVRFADNVEKKETGRTSSTRRKSIISVVPMSASQEVGVSTGTEKSTGVTDSKRRPRRKSVASVIPLNNGYNNKEDVDKTDGEKKTSVSVKPTRRKSMTVSFNFEKNKASGDLKSSNKVENKGGKMENTKGKVENARGKVENIRGKVESTREIASKEAEKCSEIQSTEDKGKSGRNRRRSALIAQSNMSSYKRQSTEEQKNNIVRGKRRDSDTSCNKEKENKSNESKSGIVDTISVKKTEKKSIETKSDTVCVNDTEKKNDETITGTECSKEIEKMNLGSSTSEGKTSSQKDENDKPMKKSNSKKKLLASVDLEPNSILIQPDTCSKKIRPKLLANTPTEESVKSKIGKKRKIHVDDSKSSVSSEPDRSPINESKQIGDAIASLPSNDSTYMSISQSETAVSLTNDSLRSDGEFGTSMSAVFSESTCPVFFGKPPPRQSIDEFNLRTKISHHSSKRRKLNSEPRFGTLFSDSSKSSDSDSSGGTRKRSPHKPGLVMTSLHSHEQELVMSIVKKLGAFLITDNVTENTTHVVCGGPRRTLNILHAITHGCWVVSKDWVLQSLEQGGWKPEVEFEVTEWFPTAKIARELKESNKENFHLDLFSSLSPMYISPKSAPPRSHLVALVQATGGKITSSSSKARLYVGQEFHPDKTSVTPLFILDCITQNKLLSMDSYLLGKPKRESSPEY